MPISHIWKVVWTHEKRQKKKYALKARIVGDISQLLAIGNATLRIRRAALRRRKALQSEWHSSFRTRLEITNKGILRALELTLEQPVQLGVLWRLLAVRNGKRVGGVARLLDKDLRKLDHVGVVVELLCEIDHLVGCVLLVAGTCRREQSHEGSLGDWLALISSTCRLLERKKMLLKFGTKSCESKHWTYAGLYPFGGRGRDSLSNALVERASLSSGGQSGKSESKNGGSDHRAAEVVTRRNAKKNVFKAERTASSRNE